MKVFTLKKSPKLQMVRDIVGLEGISAASLEEMDFGFGGSQTALSNANWVTDNEIADLGRTNFAEPDNLMTGYFSSL